MNNEIKVGIIGVGYWGKNLVRNYYEMGNLVSIYDDNSVLADSMCETYTGLEKHSSLENILSSDIDAVVIATPAVTHGKIVRQALALGKHVFVEKPICLDLGEAKELAKLAKEKNQILMVGHLLLYHSAFKKLKSFIDEGGIGDIRYIVSNRLSLGKIRREENALWSFAPHDVSMILQLTGSIPTTINAMGGDYLATGVADTTLSFMEFENKVQAHIFVSWLYPYKDQRLVVVGDKAMVVFNDTKPHGEKLEVYKHQAEWDGEIPIVNKVQPEYLDYPEYEPLRAECEHFVMAISSNTTPLSDAEEGIRVLMVLDACQKSLVSGDKIKL